MNKFYYYLFFHLLFAPLLGKAQDNYSGIKLTGIGVRVLQLGELNNLLQASNYPELKAIQFNVGIEGYLELDRNHITIGYQHYFNPFQGYNQEDSIFTKSKGNVIKFNYARYSFFVGQLEVLPTLGVEINTFKFSVEKRPQDNQSFQHSLLFSANQRRLQNLSGNLFVGTAVNLQTSDREITSLTLGYSIPLSGTWYEHNAKLTGGPRINASGFIANLSFTVLLNE